MEKAMERLERGKRWLIVGMAIVVLLSWWQSSWAQEANLVQKENGQVVNFVTL
jgi:hypothetical protein